MMNVSPADSPLDLKTILSGAQLPALPQSAVTLLELSKDSENGPAEFAVAIETDPGLTSQVLRFVNSSYFGFSREISSVKLAITLVGIRTIKNFALWSAVFSLMPNPRCGPFDLKKLWQDSLRRGLFARTFGKLLGMRDAEGPFAAALLQDLAVPMLAKDMPGRYFTLLEQRNKGAVRLSDLERAAFGWTHAEAGGMIARRWNLPEEFVSMIEQHGCVDQVLSGSGEDPGQVAVTLSSLLPASCDETWIECSRFETAYNKFRPAGGLEVDGILSRVDHLFAEFAPVLNLTAPAKSLADAFHQAVSVTP